jgi:hypothetical protein
MPFTAFLLPILTFLMDHISLFETLFTAITSGKLTKDDAQRAIDQAIVMASDAEMQREFPKGGPAA